MKKIRDPKKKAPYLRQMIADIPVSADFDSLPDEVKDELRTLDIREIQILQGCQIDTGRLLVLFLCYAPRVDAQAMFDGHSLDWQIVACEGEKMKAKDLEPYWLGVPTYDENGDQIGAVFPDDPEEFIQTFAGHTWVVK